MTRAEHGGAPVAVNPSEPGPPGRPHPVPVPPAAGPPDDAVGELVDAAVAVLAVAAATVRYAVEAAARETRAALPRLPIVGRGRPLLRRVLPGVVAEVLAHPAAAAARALGAVADELVPGVARAVLSRLDVSALVREFVDVDQIAGQLDVNAVAARIDLEAVVRRLDVDAIAAGLDLDTLVEKVDVARVIDRVDLDAVVARVDLDRAVDRVDVARVVGRVDVDAIAAGLDLDALVEKVDVARVVDRVDIDRVVARADVAGLARYVVDEIDLPGLLRTSTGSVTGEMVRGVRAQGADADRAVERVVDRLLRRRGRRTDATGDGEPPEAGHDDR